MPTYIITSTITVEVVMDITAESAEAANALFIENVSANVSIPDVQHIVSEESIVSVDETTVVQA